MENYVNVDLARRRMHCRAIGTWDMERAVAFRHRMIEVVDSMLLSGEAFSALTDLTGLAVHAQAIAPIIAEGAGQMRRARLSQYAMIVPSPLLRLQVRRLHEEIAPRFCNTCAEAVAWLDWTEQPIDVLMPPSRPPSGGLH